MESSEIEYFKEILQRDMLILILFVLSVNPLSFMPHKEEGYKIGKEERTTNLSHLFFVDDLNPITYWGGGGGGGAFWPDHQIIDHNSKPALSSTSKLGDF